MIQLLLHLIGDFILQPDRMAVKKTESLYWALSHGIIYSLPFYFILKPSLLAISIIIISHTIIDRFRLAKYIIFFKNWILDRDLKWAHCKNTGYPNQLPNWLSMWLLIIVDNTLHLVINYLSLIYL